MKKTILLTLCCTWLLAGCVSQQEEYSKAYDAAIKTPLKDEKMGFGFRPNMTRAEAEAHLVASRKAGELVVNLPALGKHPLEEVELGYFRDTLAVVRIKVEDSDVYYSEVEELLAKRYTSTPYHHDEGDKRAASWFSGPIQVQVEYDKILGVQLSYMDMRRYSQHINELVDETLKDIQDKEAQVKKDAERL